MNDLLSDARYSDGDVDTNKSSNPSLTSIINLRVSRRVTVFGGAKATSMAVFGTALLAACDEDDLLAPGADVRTLESSSGLMVELTASSAATVAQIGGTPVGLLDGEGAPGRFIAPAVASSTEYRFSITENDQRNEARVVVNPAQFAFGVVDKNFEDAVTVPNGYSVAVLTALGDPISTAVPAYANDGTDTDFDRRIGDHGDALYYFGLGANGMRDDTSLTRAVLAQNHENLNVQYLHPSGPTVTPDERRPEEEAIKEIEAHGISFVEIRDDGGRHWSYVQDSAINRRVTPNTPIEIRGPVRGSAMVRTRFSPEGTNGRGTINNCANGATAWGTLLTCEENWAGYFLRAGDDAFRTAQEQEGLNRYGVNRSPGNYGWATVQASARDQDLFSKWDARATNTDPEGALSDYRNEPNQFGWVVEIDPYAPSAAPRKRTALGRMGHEGAWMGKVEGNSRLAVYMGDDSRSEYFYKFVSAQPFDENDRAATDRLAIGDKYLDDGTLYVAIFEEDGTGRWAPLVFGQVPDTATYTFADQADVLVHARIAADAMGATTMDRPEWTSCNPVTGEIYLTLTNNRSSSRTIDEVNPANPRFYRDPPEDRDSRYGNPNGHIIRVRENGDDPASTTFTWDIYLFGADSNDSDQTGVDRNTSGLSDDNDFSSPDGLWFARSQNPAGQINPIAWIQTDDSAMNDRTNDQMLVALPGSVGDGAARIIQGQDAAGQTSAQQSVVGAPATSDNLRRFLVGPNECEITGVDSTPDGRTLFVGIQHPGENADDPNQPTSNWPQSQSGNNSGRPRSGVVAITKDDGGIVGF